jgi:dephospho-CoA kinase
MSGHASLVVGLTGGIGTGKTRVANLLEKLGAALICADRVVHDLQAPGSEVLGEIARVLGEEYISDSGELERDKLGALVFRDPSARAKLNAILHPRVLQTMAERSEALQREGIPVIVLDIPLLIEGRRAFQGPEAVVPVDQIVLVYADEMTQIERVVARDGLSREAALARVRSQMPIDEKRTLADVVIDNGGAWPETERQVQELYRRWTSRSHPEPQREPQG